MTTDRIFSAFFASVLLATTAWAQFGTPLPLMNQKPEAETERTGRWRAGIIVEASSGPCASIFGTFPVPVAWPEQDVKVVDEVMSDAVRQSQYRDLESGVRQMVVAIPRLEAGEKAEAVLTFEITRRVKPLPLDTSIYSIPESMPRDARKCLSNSPFIDGRHSRIRTLAKEITSGHDTAWDRVQAIHDWVKENIEHTNDPLQGTLDTLQRKKGNHEALAGIFIALCRACKVPARTVWVPGYCYAEFYLGITGGKDEEGEWFPCELKEKTVFGTVSQPYLILQKGENVQVPESKERKRFVPEFLHAKSGTPKVTVVRDTK